MHERARLSKHTDPKIQTIETVIVLLILVTVFFLLLLLHFQTHVRAR